MIGANVPQIGGIEKGFSYAHEWNCECIQIYTTQSRTWNTKDLAKEKVNDFASAWKTTKVKKSNLTCSFSSQCCIK